MKTENIKSKQSHYELLLRAYDKAQAALERAKTNEKTARHYMKTADKDVSKTDMAILELEYQRAKFRRKGRKAAFKIAKLRLKQWLKLHEEDVKLYQLNAESEKKDEGKSEEKATKEPDAVGGEEEVIKPTKKSRTSFAKGAVTKVSESEEILNKPKRKYTKSSDKQAGVTQVEVSEEVSKPVKKQKTPSVKAQKKEETFVDMTIIEGIGPKVNELLQAAGISDFKNLVEAKVETLKEILIANRLKFINPSTWAEQAQLVIDGKMDDLKMLQEQLKGGRRK